MHNLEFKKNQFCVFIKTISKHNSRNVRITRAALLKEDIIICFSNCPRIMWNYCDSFTDSYCLFELSCPL